MAGSHRAPPIGVDTQYLLAEGSTTKVCGSEPCLFNCLFWVNTVPWSSQWIGVDPWLSTTVTSTGPNGQPTIDTLPQEYRIDILPYDTFEVTLSAAFHDRLTEILLGVPGCPGTLTGQMKSCEGRHLIQFSEALLRDNFCGRTSHPRVIISHLFKTAHITPQSTVSDRGEQY